MYQQSQGTGVDGSVQLCLCPQELSQELCTLGSSVLPLPSTQQSRRSLRSQKHKLVFSSVTTLPWGGFTPRTPSASSPGQQQQHLSEVSLVALTLCHCRSSSVSLVLEEIPGLKPAAQHLLLSCSRGESCGARGCAWLLADPWLSVLGCHR